MRAPNINFIIFVFISKFLIALFNISIQFNFNNSSWQFPIKFSISYLKIKLIKLFSNKYKIKYKLQIL